MKAPDMEFLLPITEQLITLYSELKPLTCKLVRDVSSIYVTTKQTADISNSF